MRIVANDFRRWARKFARRAVGWQAFGRVAYSQEGEDLVVAKLLGVDARYDVQGFYVDVGAHHPFRYSNTYYFYQRGWRGLNIDAAKGIKALFDKERPRDINVELAVAREKSIVEFLEFNEKAISSCNRDLASQRDGHNGYKIVGRHRVPAQPLREILESLLPTNQPIDFLSVDIEGLDVDALASNDWHRWRPKLVIAEDANVLETADIAASPLGELMEKLGYVSVSKLGLSIIFADKSRLHQTDLGLRVW